MLTDRKLAKKISLTYDEWQDWLNQNTPQDRDIDSTMELLAFFGFQYYMMCKENMPSLDIQKLETILFGSEPDASAVIASLKQNTN